MMRVGSSKTAGRWVGAGFVTVVLLLAVQVVWVLPPVRAHLGVNWPGDEVLADVLYVLTAVLVLARAVLVSRERGAWLLLGCGLLSYAAGNIYWYALVHAAPSGWGPLADILWIVSYPCFCLSLLGLLRARVPRLRAAALLDGLIAAACASAFAALPFLATVVADSRTSTVTLIVNLAYPVADTVLAGCVLGSWAMTGWRTDLVWLLLLAGIASFGVADCAYLLQVADGTYVVGTWLDFLWHAGAAVMAAAAWREDRPARANGRLHAGASVALPALLACACVALLLYGSWRDTHLPRVSAVLAAAAITAGIARMVMTVRAARALADAHRQARTDDLTGLPNRRLFLERLDAALEQTDQHDPIAVALIDLDRFKDVNDSFGHHAGDQLLQLVSIRLRDALGSQAMLARLGGDEFGALLPAEDTARAAHTAGALLAALQQPFELDEIVLHADASIGIAVWPEHGPDRTSLLRHADAAMYAAKTHHTGFRVASDTSHDAARQRLATLEELRAGLGRGELILHYQPQIDIASGRLTGVEALVRWDHPVRGLIYPDGFLPIAEQAGLMGALTLHVLDTALRQVHDWRNEGIDITVAVNVSASNLDDADLPAHVAEALTRYRLPPHVLHLEVTEEILMRDPAHATQILNDLRRLGIRLAVDDYGTGYSSLTYLHALPVDDLKLDRAFVTHCDDDPRSAAIVASTVELSHNLGMRMIAEGVETQTVLDRLHQWGCDLAQGYHLGRPQAAEQLTPRLRQHRLITPREQQPTAP